MVGSGKKKLRRESLALPQKSPPRGKKGLDRKKGTKWMGAQSTTPQGKKRLPHRSREAEKKNW